MAVPISAPLAKPSGGSSPAAATQKTEELISFQQKLTSPVARGEGVVGIAGVLRQRTGLDVLIQDTEGRILAATHAELALVGLTTAAGVRCSTSPAGRAVRWGGRWLAVVCPDEDVLGTIVLWDPDDTAEDFDLLALREATMVLALELLRLRSVGQAELGIWGDLATELLDGTDRRRTDWHARQLGYDLNRPHRVVVVRLPDGGATGQLAAVCHEISRWVRNMPVTIRDRKVLLIVSEDLNWLQLVTSLATTFGARIRLGVGGKYEPDDLQRSRRDATLALNLTAAWRGAGPVASFDDLGVWKLFAGNVESSSLHSLVTEWIRPLVDYDERRGAEFVKTITVYLQRSCEIEATAAALFVHRNTLVYRLKRIAQITGNDLGDADRRFHMDLACRAWATMQALSEGQIEG